jgi:hypothetical protein
MALKYHLFPFRKQGNPVPKNSKLKIFLACSEYTPLAKTGGLADVSAALSFFFDSEGHDIRVLIPFYASIDLAGLEIEIVPGLQELTMTLGDRVFNYWIVRARSEGPGPDIYLLQTGVCTGHLSLSRLAYGPGSRISQDPVFVGPDVRRNEIRVDASQHRVPGSVWCQCS